MPDMSECEAWQEMCAPIQDWSLCSAQSGNNIPPMRMYFHWGIMDYVLLQAWVPNSSLTYAATWIAVFVITVLFEVLKLVRTRYERRWTEELNEYVSVNSDNVQGPPFRFQADFMRAILHTIEVGWGFLVMLVVMTYNVGLFIAVLAGSFIGMLFVGRFVQYVPKAGCH